VRIAHNWFELKQGASEEEGKAQEKAYQIERHSSFDAVVAAAILQVSCLLLMQ
jgi:hypothetical protein